ncbi:hypothetical protein ITJ66_16380 [Plantibacter sp. VKM Ac-2885]|uniref:hypothetical protein n=1 Tax=Plantibacter sp. VKM Ac-2885 TaxID=2783828 RepID=UPI00188B7915|nr:hypothetical protein [Plantibacter sp. VKM Ac-2885]MBF4514063.1 hypothetical protein [Plantibacter sp. VKM Ac-2885]
MRRPLLVGLLAVGAITLTGCVDADTAPQSTASSTGRTDGSPAAPDREPVARAATSDLGIAVYELGSYVTTQDSGLLRQPGGTDRFPAGSFVIVIQVSLDGFVPFGELDLSGLTVRETSWAGLGDTAELDTNEGPDFAADKGVPWGPAGAQGRGRDWSLPNHLSTSFSLAYYVPFGVSALDLVVDVPSQRAPLTLSVPIHAE